MNIILLFGLFPEEIRGEIISSSRGGIQYAANSLQHAIVQGFLDNGAGSRVKLLNLPFVGTYPKNYRLFKSSSFDFSITCTNGSIQGQNSGYCHLVGWQLISRYLHAKKALLKWAKTTPGRKVVISYNIHTPFFKAAVAVKKNFPDIHICQIVPDLAEYMATDKGLYAMLRRVNCGLQSRLFRHVDSYVLLSKYMADRLLVGDKPWIVVEGIYNSVTDDVKVEGRDTGEKWILYSGTLAQRYGVLNLVNAFTLLHNSDYRLIICGAGGAQAEICDKAKEDPRIIYKGQLPREEVLKLQRMSNLLVNPRTPEGEFTKYSFPSKTMEYLASGVPTLLYKLPGIPEEYYNYCFTVDGLSVENLASKIGSVLSMKKETLADFGMKAREFILTQKNPQKQCKKILDLIQY